MRKKKGGGAKSKSRKERSRTASILAVTSTTSVPHTACSYRASHSNIRYASTGHRIAAYAAPVPDIAYLALDGARTEGTSPRKL
eukprot:3748623-Rhodomonas_salina.3